jgi:hypothetical protein
LVLSYANWQLRPKAPSTCFRDGCFALAHHDKAALQIDGQTRFQDSWTLAGAGERAERFGSGSLLEGSQ